MLVVMAALPLWAGCGGLPGNAVAEVDGNVITKDDLNRIMELYQQQYAQAGMDLSPGTPDYKKAEQQILDSLVLTEVGMLEADRMDIEVSDEDVAGRIDELKQQAGGEDAFNQQMEQYGLTLESVEEDIYANLVLEKLFIEATKEVPAPTDEEALKYYEENKAQFQNPSETRKVRHILVKDEATAQEIKSRLDAGEDFATLAAEYSTDPGSKDAGGSLGVVPTVDSGFVPEFEQALAQLAAGQTSGLVQTQFGYHIIRVDKIIPPNTLLTFEEMKDDIKLQLQQMGGAKEQFFTNWLNEKKSQYEIIYAEGYGPAPEQTETQPQATTTPAQ